jgi:hypothetical protein
MQLGSQSPDRRALILTAGTVNHLYDTIGKRFAEVFQALGWSVNLQTVPDYQPAEYDLVLFSNITDIVVAFAKLHNIPSADLYPAAQYVRQVARRANKTGVLLMEPANSLWFSYASYWCHETDVIALYDIGFHSQQHSVPQVSGKLTYHFLVNGLRLPERAALEKRGFDHQSRPIPWTFIGKLKQWRSVLAYRLATEYTSQGFLYLSEQERLTEDEQYLENEKLQRILEASRYYIWTPQGDYFYAESERFRNAALAGCIPIKVQEYNQVLPLNLPFSYLIMEIDKALDTLHNSDCTALWQRFATDYLALPSLETEVARVILQEQREEQTV